VKIKIRPEHASMLQMNDWPSGLRDGEDARGAAPPSSRDPGRASRGYPPFSLTELEWHHDDPADEAHPRWQISGKPGR
jgi:hypothetical protein